MNILIDNLYASSRHKENFKQTKKSKVRRNKMKNWNKLLNYF